MVLSSTETEKTEGEVGQDEKNGGTTQGLHFGQVMLKLAVRSPGGDVDRQLTFARNVLLAEMKGHKKERGRGDLG